MRAIYFFIITLFIAALPGFARGLPNSNDIIVKMKTDLDLQNEQVTDITPIIEKYCIAFQALQKSIDDGTINQSTIDSQWQGIEAEETQELSQYLKAYQLSEWSNLQSQIYQRKDNGDSATSADGDEYSNLPGSN